MQKGSIVIVGTVGVPAHYGGFETLVDNLVEGERNFVVYCSAQAYSVRPRRYKNADLVYLPIRANGFQSILYDIWSLVHASFSGGRRILVLGVSGAPILPFLRLIFPRIYLVVNVDGLEWRRDKWGYFAKRILKWFERIAVNSASVVIADNHGISKYLTGEYGVDSIMIPYGGDHALKGVIYQDGGDYGLSICRIEPENNVEMILEAFSRVSIPLKFVGNWSASEFGRDLRHRYAKFPNISLIDPIYDLDELGRMRSSCLFYVHGHSAGGTNPSLVEIMHFSKPIFAFDCIYNRSTLEGEASYFLDADALEECLLSREWQDQNVDAIYEIASRRYTWESVRSAYMELFPV